MGSNKNAAADEAAQARKDEQARQDAIRQGTTRINSIFDGGTVGDGALAAGTAYNPTGTYYNADGTAWSPTGKGSAEKQFSTALSNGSLFSGAKTNTGFNDAFYNGRQQAFLDYANPQLESQYGDAQKQLTFALARNGTLDSSVRGEKVGDLQKTYDLNKQQIADQALSSSNDARNSVEDARSNLIAQLNATGDAQGAANAALARSSALSQPAAYSPLTNLFGDFTSALGQQAQLEQANALSGGQTGVRYNTGLFGNAGAVKVY
jgi:hypothetical protein